ncbi:hypothetical protein [Acidiphilium sp.]|uniref:hypothetical protein n=1 Tax=Acidiphilium sp. TaxID=527 RepID=UPI002586D2E9|nr:hypothetical protein [Acidiphilium sp.]
MTKKQDLPETAPTFWEGHLAVAVITYIAGALSALALGYHIYSAATIEHEAVRWLFVLGGGAFAFGLALTPMNLARAHGSAIEGASAQNAILGIVCLFMVIDGALQVHAAYYFASLLGYKDVPLWMFAIGALAFQLGAFFARGAVHQASKEIADLIKAEKERLAAIEARARADANARRREREEGRRLALAPAA